MMDSSRFGKKHTCLKCRAKFYDMNKDPPVCPKCDTDQDDEALCEEPIVTSEELEAAVTHVFNDDESIPGDLELEVGGLDGDDLVLPVVAEDLGGDVVDDV